VADFDRAGVFKAIGLHPHNAAEYDAAFKAEMTGF